MAASVYVIGIAGGTGSGKTHFTRAVAAKVASPRLGVLIMDWYYRDVPGADPLRHNFDTPESYDVPLLAEHLRALHAGERIVRPVYDYRNHRRAAEGEPFGPYEVLLLEGILVLSIDEIARMLDLRIYIDLPADLRLIRRLRRDLRERGRDVDSVLGQYLHTVRPMHEQHIRPARAKADLVVPGHKNDAFVDDVATRIRAVLDGRPNRQEP